MTKARGTLEAMELGEIFADRPMQSGLLYVPRQIHLDAPKGDAQFLVWERPNSPENVTLRHAKPGMLEGFVRLFEKKPAEILSYAKKWGVLGLCRHDLPCSHNQYADGLTDGIRPCLPMLELPLPADLSRARFREPLEVWRRLSRQASALLNIGASLNQQKLGAWDDWKVIKGDYDRRSGGLLNALGLGGGKTRPYMQKIAHARRELASELDGWISLGQVRPRGAWQPKTNRWRFTLDAVSSGPNLFGMIALAITLAIAGAELAVCDGCGNSYRPDRRPNPDRRNYCEECRGGRGKNLAAWRAASREYRKRKREKGPTETVL
jgi:hypothetical protein